ncbi:MAG: DMT family transporter [Bacilli bacterium]|jgi:drug/metabolite transporter (DMT)-like permease
MTSSKKITLIAVLTAIASALLSSFYLPVSSLLMQNDGLSALFMGGFSFLGGAIAALVMFLGEKIYAKKKHLSIEPYLNKKDFLILSGQICSSIASTICLLYAIKLTSAENVSLYSSFEILFTSLLALIVFKEIIHVPSWIGIILIAAGCTLLSVDFTSTGSIAFSWGSLLALASCAIWGIDNNLSRLLSHKNKNEATMVKGFVVGPVLLIIGFCIGDRIVSLNWLYSLMLGTVTIGVSIILYMWAQKTLGASKTSAFYMFSPFLGSLISLVILKATPNWNYYVALGSVVVGQFFVLFDLLKRDKKKQEKRLE